MLSCDKVEVVGMGKENVRVWGELIWPFNLTRLSDILLFPVFILQLSWIIHLSSKNDWAANEDWIGATLAAVAFGLIVGSVAGFVNGVSEPGTMILFGSLLLICMISGVLSSTSTALYFSFLSALFVGVVLGIAYGGVVGLATFCIVAMVNSMAVAIGFVFRSMFFIYKLGFNDWGHHKFTP